MIFAGESFDLSAFVLFHPPLDVVAHADVKSAGTATNDINPIFLAIVHYPTSCHPEAGESFGRRLRQDDHPTSPPAQPLLGSNSSQLLAESQLVFPPVN